MVDVRRCPRCNFELVIEFEEGKRYLVCVNKICDHKEEFPVTPKETEDWK
jgi:uncharacterized C2H2 Zn-finger protein